MNKSDIDYLTHTWNPITGCLHECRKTYCYASKMVNRFSGWGFQIDGRPICNCNVDTGAKFGVLHDIEKPLTKDFPDNKGPIDPYPFGFEPTFHRYRLNEPAKLKKPSTIGVVYMGDLFGDWILDEWIEKVFESCEAAPQHKYLFLTKNPKRYKEVLPLWKSHHGKLTNMWFGTTVTGDSDKQKAWDLLTSTNKNINKFLSVEPLLSAFNLNDCELLLKDYKNKATIGNYIDWIIVGAQTGPGAKPPNPEWVQLIINQAREANIPVFMKSNLKSCWEGEFIQQFPEGLRGNE